MAMDLADVFAACSMSHEPKADELEWLMEVAAAAALGEGIHHETPHDIAMRTLKVRAQL